ncbi:uncharacterized protein LOC143864822 [Tasmannia lanceolata]|uniref:uncharacterized protein LOC143864822 n=1 Tax=Tasmannia lanceolata TaxID=3420 RepID=UPI004062E5BA
MADKPSRALIIYGDGFVPLISPSHSNLHSFASQSSCGFLSLRESPPQESEDERVVREFAQLLDAYDAYNKVKGEHANIDSRKDLLVPTISERFMGLRAAIFTTCAGVENFGRNLGFSILDFDQLIKNNHSYNDPREVPDPFSTACELLRSLGFQGDEILEKSDFDLVFVHIGAGEKATSLKDRVNNTGIEWVNTLVGAIMQIAQPGSPIASRLHLSLVMSYGAVPENEDHSSSILISQKGINSDLSVLCPHQSYAMKEGKLLHNIRHHHPMLVAQWQEAVTRKDMAMAFSFKEFDERGANLAILADRFLHEVAFKLWKAPKYGA